MAVAQAVQLALCLQVAVSRAYCFISHVLVGGFQAADPLLAANVATGRDLEHLKAGRKGKVLPLPACLIPILRRLTSVFGEASDKQLRDMVDGCASPPDNHSSPSQC